MSLIESILVKDGEFVDVWDEVHAWDFGDGTFKTRVARNKAGDFVTLSESFADALEESGVVPELADPDDDVCTIGYSSKMGKWYGWSHRSFHGFAIGDRLFSPPETSTPPGPQDPLILTREEQRKSAIAFAEYMG